MRVLVTGSSGMIGTAVAERLRDLGHEVLGADRRPNAWNPAIDRVTTRIDLRDPGEVRARLPVADTVLHFAANARVHDLVIDPSLARDNFEMTFNVLEHCRLHQVPRVVIASSREVYGSTEVALHAEGDARVELSASPYAACKLATEALAASYGRCYGTGIVVMRFSNVYGRYDTSDRVIPKFLRAAIAGRVLEVYGADKLLDFTYLDDCVGGIVSALSRFERAAGRTFNIATGAGASLLELAELVRGLVSSTSSIEIGNNRVGEVERYIADITLARELFDYAPTTPLAEGIRRTLAWYREHDLLEDPGREIASAS